MLHRKAALQFTPQQIVQHTDTNFTYTVRVRFSMFFVARTHTAKVH